MNNVTIRKVAAGDEIGIARVHIKAWQEAYCGLLPTDFLEKLPNEMNERIEMWTSIIASSKRWAWVAESATGIAGFILFGPARDTNREGQVELGAIYLLASEHGKGIGYQLLCAGFQDMRARGYEKAYCWVLENNPTIRFYEKTGARFASLVKQDEIGGKTFNELAYEWGSLKTNT